MSPAKRTKAASKKGRKAGGKARKGSKPKAAPRTGAKARRAKPAARKPAKSAKAKPMAAAGHAHCAATDPFGDVCQNLPRRPSKYCVIHSYLER